MSIRRALIDGDVLVHWTLWNATNLQELKDSFQFNRDNWVGHSMSDEPQIALGGPTNFRDELHPSYKKVPSREKGRKDRPHWYGDAIEFARSLPESKVAEGQEADDLLAIWQDGDDIIVSVDKDLRQVPGLHFCPRSSNLGLRDTFDVSPEEAKYNLDYQLLVGDPMDVIPGLPRVGPKTGVKLLAAGKTPIEMYKEVYGDDWEEQFLFNGRLLFLRRFNGDDFSVERYQQL